MADEALGIQYATAAQERETVTLGMWAFLATEVLFFGALVVAYVNYRIWFGAEFIAAARHDQGRVRNGQYRRSCSPAAAAWRWR